VAEAPVTTLSGRGRAAVPPPRDEQYERAVVARLAQVVADGDKTALSIRPLRSAARSRSYLAERADASGDTTRWFVKQTRPEWVQDDLASPVTAEEEFRALRRLHAHLSGFDARIRVPRPEAVFPELATVVMEYVPGRRLVDLLRYQSLVSPQAVLEALTTSARFLERVHSLEEPTSHVVDLRVEAESIRRFVAEELEPAGLSLPAEVDRALRRMPETRLESQQVLLHGDFAPHNILLADDGSIVGVDPALTTFGPPEDDLARFVAMVSGAVRFAPELVVPPLRVVRRTMVERLLSTYYHGASTPPLLDVRLLHVLPRRWLRLRQLAGQHHRGSRAALRLRVIDAQMRFLITESAGRVVRRVC